MFFDDLISCSLNDWSCSLWIQLVYLEVMLWLMLKWDMSKIRLVDVQLSIQLHVKKEIIKFDIDPACISNFSNLFIFHFGNFSFVFHFYLVAMLSMFKCNQKNYFSQIVPFECFLSLYISSFFSLFDIFRFLYTPGSWKPKLFL